MRGAKRLDSGYFNIHNSCQDTYSSKKRRNQQRAAEFRTSQENKRVIKLIDARGNTTIIKQKGRMGITKHVNIISALEKRVLRYHNKDHHKEDSDDRLYHEAVDETGTIDTTTLSDIDADKTGEQK